MDKGEAEMNERPMSTWLIYTTDRGVTKAEKYLMAILFIGFLLLAAKSILTVGYQLGEVAYYGVEMTYGDNR